MEFLELKSKITKMENIVDELNRKLNRDFSLISKLEDISVEIIQLKNTEKKDRKCNYYEYIHT